MRNNFLLYIVLCSLFGIVMITQFGCKPAATKEEMTNEEKIARGKYLVTASGCNDCHSVKVFSEKGMGFDSTKLLAGHPADMVLSELDTSKKTIGNWVLANHHLTAWIGPWGISYAANLTPHEATGIGNWTDEIFIKALRTGKHMGIGRPILPPMPWENIGQFTDEDLSAILAYLKSIPPINNKVPDPVPPNMVGSYIKQQAGTAKL